MDTTVVVALIGVIGTLGGSLIGYLTTAKVTAYRIDQLEKKVDSIANKLDEINTLRETCALQDERIAQIMKRLEELPSGTN